MKGPKMISFVRHSCACRFGWFLGSEHYWIACLTLSVIWKPDWPNSTLAEVQMWGRSTLRKCLGTMPCSKTRSFSFEAFFPMVGGIGDGHSGWATPRRIDIRWVWNSMMREALGKPTISQLCARAGSHKTIFPYLSSWRTTQWLLNSKSSPPRAQGRFNLIESYAAQAAGENLARFSNKRRNWLACWLSSSRFISGWRFQLRNLLISVPKS